MRLPHTRIVYIIRTPSEEQRIVTLICSPSKHKFNRERIAPAIDHHTPVIGVGGAEIKMPVYVSRAGVLAHNVSLVCDCRVVSVARYDANTALDAFALAERL